MSGRWPKASSAAMRPCSAETAARLGKPMTSPTAQTCCGRGAVALADLEQAALGGDQPEGLQADPVDRAPAAGRVEHDVGGDLLAALQARDRAVRVLLDRDHLLADAQRQAPVAQVEEERLDDLLVAERQDVRAAVDQGHLRAQGREHRGVLDADHARAHDDHRVRDLLQVEDPVRVEDGALVERDAVRVGRPRAGREDEPLGADAALAVVRDHLQLVGAGERGHAVDHGHVVAHELVAHHVALGLDDLLHARSQVAEGEVGLHPEGLAVDLALAQAGEVEDRLAQRLAGDRPGVRRDAAEHRPAVDDHGPLVQLGRLHRGLQAARTRPDDRELVLGGHVPNLHGPGLAGRRSRADGEGPSPARSRRRSPRRSCAA